MDIAAWLRQLGLERYEEAFRANEVDGGGHYPELTDADHAASSGLPLGHPRRILLKAIRDLTPDHHRQPTPASQLGHRPGPMRKRLCQDQRPSGGS